MEIDEAIALAQDRLAEEGGTMGELLGHFRNRISPVLIGDRQWERIRGCAGKLPIAMGALPFGFEPPLHERSREADFGASLASGTRTATFFEERAWAARADETAKAIVRLFERMDREVSPLRDIPAVEAAIERFGERVNIVRTGRISTRGNRVSAQRSALRSPSSRDTRRIHAIGWTG